MRYLFFLFLIFLSIAGYCEESEKQPQNDIKIPKVIDIALTTCASFCILDDGSIIGWGLNSRGCLARGTNVDFLCPGRLHIEGVKAVAGFQSPIIFLKNDGTVWSCGRQNLRARHNDTSEDICEPVQVQDIDNVKAIAAGNEYLLALREDGTVWVWGKGNTGLKDQPDVNNRTPVQVAGLQSIVAIGAWDNRSLALDENGQLWAWGINQSNTLGLNVADAKKSIGEQREPAKVPLCNNVTAFSTCENMTLVLRKDGKAAALGGGNTVRYRIPISESNRPDFNTYFVIDDFDKVTSAAAAFYSLVLTLADGRIMCWGDNQFGHLALPESEKIAEPTEMVLPMKFDKVIFGSMHSLALKDGKVYAWGCNQYAQLGRTMDANRHPKPLEVDLSEAINEIMAHKAKK